MNRSFWRRFWAIPGEIAIELVHVFYKRERCKPILSKIIYLIATPIYIAVAAYLLLLVSVLGFGFATSDFFSLPVNILAVALVFVLCLKLLVFLCENRPSYDSPHLLFRWQYIAEGSCDQISRCIGCNDEGSKRVRHDLENHWTYDAEDSCKQHRNCKRCDFVDRREAPHQFGEWAYTSDDNCDQSRSCSRCNKPEVRIHAHQYSAWNYVASGNCTKECICAHCGDKQVIKEWHRPASLHEPADMNQCMRCKAGLETPEPENPAETSSDQDEDWAYKWVYW